ncbi:hypothetical protein [Microbulbifer sp. ALW1]|uniref:hypothetical protein n=1 Tax=Microbulbifer sp. (strain ALW1) TaxID=1516059 RepID=UPI00135C5C6C|nr:hypothetical protein [Microbulbifer sp. ALW1]
MRKISPAHSITLPLFLTALLIPGHQAIAESLKEQLQQCSQFSDNDKRLACYDKISGSLRQHAEQQFGQEQQQVIEEAPEAITAKIVSAEEGVHGKFTFTLDNGQVWRQVGSSTRNFWKGGEQVTIQRGALGSYLMRKETGGRSLRVKRIQ